MIRLVEVEAFNHGVDPHLDREVYLDAASAAAMPVSASLEFGPFEDPEQAQNALAAAWRALNIGADPTGAALDTALRELEVRVISFEDEAGQRLDCDALEAPPAVLPDRRGFALIVALRLPARAAAAPGLVRVLVAEVARLPRFARLLLAPRLKPQLNVSREIVGAASAQPSNGPHGTALSGKGVILGVIDFGCDFASRNFRNSAGTTRLLRLWDQNAERVPGGTVAYGRVYRPDEINAAMQSGTLFVEHVWDRLGYVPSANYYTVFDGIHGGTHGTAVLDVAAGNGGAYGAEDRDAWAGFAPGADIVFVQVRVARDSTTQRTVLYADSVLDAVRFIFDLAAETGQPAVVNVSLNTNSGPHDGDSYVDRRMDALLRGQHGRAVVIAAGNGRGRDMHVHGTVGPGAPVSLSWRFNREDASRNDLEIWYNATGARLRVSLIDPDGMRHGPVLAERVARVERLGRPAGLVIGSRAQPGRHEPPLQGDELTIGRDTGRQVILISLRPQGVAADWGIELELDDAEATEPVVFDAWIDRDNYDLAGRFQSAFKSPPGAPTTDRCTLGSLSCGSLPIVVGGTETQEDPAAIVGYARSGEGPTRVGEAKPDLVAPAVGIAALKSGRSLSPDLRVTAATHAGLDGTSMAAPMVAGTIALMFEADPTGTRERLAEALAASATQPSVAADTERFGAGRLNVAGAVAAYVQRRPS